MIAQELNPDHVAIRSGIGRSLKRFAAGGQARVAFMGGSVTTRQWRQPVMDCLRDRFPDTEFDFIMAGIGGTNAELGAFRLPEHVLSRGPVDLFFLEFAVNGGGVRAMEGIVRQAKATYPGIDIVILYFANTSHTKAFADGRVPGIVEQHERVAIHYDIPVLYLYRVVASRIAAGEFTWDDFSTDSVHPTQLGCDIYSDCVIALLRSAQPLAVSAGVLPDPIDPLNYEHGRFVPLEAAEIVAGFERVPAFHPQKTCNFRPPVDVLACTEPGSELALEFEGRAIGIYTIVGMDAGQLAYAIDGQPFTTVELFDHYCPRFHRPQHTIFADDLVPGAHRIVIRALAENHPESEGHAIRIVKFMAH